MSSGRAFRSTGALLLALAHLLAGRAGAAGGSPELLTNAADVISLSEERAASQIKVQVTGIVTRCVPGLGGSFFIQDATSGVFVDNHDGPMPSAGDVVRITGVTEKGAYAPVITGPRWVKLGTAPLPAARMVPIESLVSGAEDSQRVEVTGIVRAAQYSTTESNQDLTIAAGGYRFHAFPILPPGLDPQSLIGAKVRLRGTAGAFFNQTQRRLTAVKLFMPLPEDFVVEATEAVDPFTQPLLPLKNIEQYRKGKRPDQRVHVKGRVTYQRPGEELFLEDQTGGLCVKTSEVGAFAIGDVVEAVGFADVENFLPVLDDAVLRKTTEAAAPLKPRKVTLQDVEDGLCHAELITLSGKLLDGFVRQDLQMTSRRVQLRTVMMLQGQDITFTAETADPRALSDLADVPIGSTIEVSGVCYMESSEDGRARSFQILMPNAREVRVLARPSWLTPQRLLAGLAILAGILLVAISWTVIISKKNAALKVLVGEKEKARMALHEAHDQLEEKVKERTEQLKLQITARKELELQSKATLAERTRLAQELHDTLEQALTGVALQLNTTSRLFEKEPENSYRHLELARNLVTESQTEVHRSVWNLRCRALEEFDLPGALRMSGQQIAEGSSLRVEITARGRIRPLPETVEENLLRIAQEALTNVIKHSGATQAEIELDYGARMVVLQVKDNGRGFAVEDHAGPGQGHFGLLGITERARRLHGKIEISSSSENGTILRVQIPAARDVQVAESTESAEPELSST